MGPKSVYPEKVEEQLDEGVKGVSYVVRTTTLTGSTPVKW